MLEIEDASFFATFRYFWFFFFRFPFADKNKESQVDFLLRGKLVFLSAVAVTERNAAVTTDNTLSLVTLMMYECVCVFSCSSDTNHQMNGFWCRCFFPLVVVVIGRTASKRMCVKMSIVLVSRQCVSVMEFGNHSNDFSSNVVNLISVYKCCYFPVLILTRLKKKCVVQKLHL